MQPQRVWFLAVLAVNRVSIFAILLPFKGQFIKRGFQVFGEVINGVGKFADFGHNWVEKITDFGHKQGKGFGSSLHTPTQFLWEYLYQGWDAFPSHICLPALHFIRFRKRKLTFTSCRFLVTFIYYSTCTLADPLCLCCFFLVIFYLEIIILQTMCRLFQFYHS